jgi:hypothetical protein
MTLKERFDQYENEYLLYREAGRPDLNAFYLLDKLIPGTEDMINGAEHDEYYLSVSPEVLHQVASDEDILFLVRCGVRYDEDVDSLALYA